MKRLARVILLVLALAIFVVSPVLAATFTASITVVESAGNSYSNLPTTIAIDNQSLASGGYMLPSGLDMQVLAGATQLPSMIASDRTLFAASQASNSMSNYTYSFGNTPRANMDIVNPYNSGIVVPDDPSLEPSYGPYPIVLGIGAGDYAAMSSIPVTFPSPTSSGYTLIVIFITYNSNVVTYDPGDFLVAYTSTSGSKTHAALYKFLNLQDSPTGVTIPLSGSVNSSYICYNIQGATRLFSSSVATGTDTAPNPPAITVSSITSDNQLPVLFLAATGSTNPITSFPSSFVDGTTTAQGTGYYTSTASRTTIINNSNPAAFTQSSSGAWTAGTIAIVGYGAKGQYHRIKGYFNMEATSLYPQVLASTTTTGSGTAGSIQIALPEGGGVNSLLLVVAKISMSGSGSTNFNLGSPWIRVSGGSSGIFRLVVYYTRDNGNITSITGTSTGTGTINHEIQVYRITNATGVVDGVVSDSTTSSNPNPPALTPALGATNYLWLAIAVTSAQSITAAPANFTPISPLNSRFVVASRELNASSLDPGVFTAASTPWIAATIAIQGGTPIVAKGDSFILYRSDTGTLTAQYWDKRLTTPTVTTLSKSGISSGIHTVVLDFIGNQNVLQLNVIGMPTSAAVLPGLPFVDNEDAWLISSSFVNPYISNYTYSVVTYDPITSLLTDYLGPTSIVVSDGISGTLLNVAPLTTGSYNASIIWGTNPAGITTTLGPIESTGTFVSTSAQPIGPDIAGNTSRGNVGGYDPNATTSGFGPLGPLFQAAVDSYNANAPGRQVTLTQVYQIMGLAIVVTAIGVVAYMTSMFFLLVIVGGILIVLCSIGVYPWAIFWVTCILMTGVWVLRIHMSPGGM